MEFKELIVQRRSVRRYEQKPVDRSLLECLAEAVRLAPSASNQQPWRLVFVDEPVLCRQVAETTFNGVVSFNRFALGAPVLAVLCREKPRVLNQVGGMIKKLDWTLVDTGIAAEHLCLQAAELGLGTCMLGWFNEARIRKLLAIPKTTRIGLVITIGWPAETVTASPRVKRRKELDEMRSYNTY
ncbi:MAG: nitroreductase family protein [Spirochaetia bacterium]|jgi:nitroreductase|nr:nitroreductase family protein [Spirochaetia bacterium]